MSDTGRLRQKENVFCKVKSNDAVIQRVVTKKRRRSLEFLHIHPPAKNTGADRTAAGRRGYAIASAAVVCADETVSVYRENVLLRRKFC